MAASGLPTARVVGRTTTRRDLVVAPHLTSRNARDGRRSSGSLGHLVARAAEHAGVRAHPSCAPAGAGASRALHLDDAVHDVFMARPVLLVPAGGTESDEVALTGRERPARSHAVSRVAQQPQAAT